MPVGIFFVLCLVPAPVIDYLREENRVLREQLGVRRMRFNDGQRRRLADKAKGLGRRFLAEVATIVTPETLLAWHRKLIAIKYHGSCAAPSLKQQSLNRLGRNSKNCAPE